MTTYSKTAAPEGETPPSFGIGQFLFAVVLTVVFFYLSKAWCVTASVKAARSITLRLTPQSASDHSRPRKKPCRGSE